MEAKELGMGLNLLILTQCAGDEGVGRANDGFTWNRDAENPKILFATEEHRKTRK
jgi:hypothetical protein